MRRLFRTHPIRVGLTIALGAMLATGCVLLETKERELVWRPVREAASWYAGLPDAVQDVYLPVPSPDGAAAGRIHAWWWPAAQPAAPTVLYLHGARWNLTGHVRRIEQLHGFGFAVLAIDYRGFGKSDGDLPSEAMAYQDAAAAWAWLRDREPDPSRRFLYGHSLGGAVAIDLAARLSREASPEASVPAAGLIVESSFTSLADIAAEMSYRWLPLGLVLSQKFDSIAKIAQVRLPVLIVHGVSDRFVPSRLSEALYAAAPEPKRLLLVEGGSHNNSMWMGSEEYRAALAELFGLATPGEPAGAVGTGVSPRPGRRG